MAIENAGGLDAVQTPSVAANAVTDAMVTGIPGAGPTIKPAASKSGIGIGATALDPTQTAELLRNMQEMIDRRSGGFAGFMSGLQDAAAWAVPGIGGQKALALDYRNKQKAQDARDVFEMKNQMAMLRAAQTQAEADAKRAQAFLGGGAGGAGGAGMGGAQMGTFESLPPEEQQRILNARPSEQFAMIQDALKRQADARLKGTFEAAGNKQEIYFVPGVGNVPMTPNQFRDLPPNIKEKIQRATFDRFGSLPSAAAGAPQLRQQGNAAEIAQGLGVPVISGYRSPEKQAELYAESQKPGYAGPPVAKPGGSQHQQGNAIDVDSRKMTPQMRQTLIDNGFVQPLPKTDPNHWELQGARQKTTEPYQVAGTAPVAPPKPIQTPAIPAAPTARAAKMPNPADYNSPAEYQAALKQFEETETQRRGIETEQAKTNIGTAAKSGEESRKKAGDMVAALEQNAKNADEMIHTADRVIKHATTRPKEFGYGYQQENPLLAGAANIPGVGAIVEKAVPAVFGAPGESARRSQTQTDASKLGLDFAAQMFSGTGARLGVGLEQMAANAKGVGPELPAETNAINANLVKVAAQKAKEQAAAWRTWRQSHGGDNADPYDFIQSGEYKAITEKYNKELDKFEEKLKSIYPQFFNENTLGKSAGEKKTRKPLGAILGGQ